MFARVHEPAVEYKSFVFLIVASVLMATIIVQRFAVPGTGGLLGLGFVAAFGFFICGLVSGILRFDPVRMLLFITAVAMLLLTILFRQSEFSLLSLMMLIILYLPFVCVFETSRSIYQELIGLYLKLMIFCSLMGIAQFGIQFLLGQWAMFPFDPFIPSSFFIEGFNLKIPIGEDLEYLKSTGFFFLEPSHFSQMLAIAMVIEIINRKRIIVLALFGLAYVTSFSGTGALLLAAVCLPLFLREKQYGLLFLVLLFLAFIPLFYEIPPFSFFFDRLSEINDPRASGFMRLIAPYWLVTDVLWTDPLAFLFGYGPGSVEVLIDRVDYAVQDTSWLKLIIEYGFVGTAGFFIFYLYALFFYSPDKLISFACLIQFLFLGGYLNAYYIQFTHLVLVVWPYIIYHTRTETGDLRSQNDLSLGNGNA